MTKSEKIAFQKTAFQADKGEVLLGGTDVALIADGLLVAEALETADILAEQGISARVVHMDTIKPLRAGSRPGVWENRYLCGELRHWRLRRGDVHRHRPAGCPVLRAGVNDEFWHSGSAGALLKQFGLLGKIGSATEISISKICVMGQRLVSDILTLISLIKSASWSAVLALENLRLLLSRWESQFAVSQSLSKAKRSGSMLYLLRLSECNRSTLPSTAMEPLHCIGYI